LPAARGSQSGKIPQAARPTLTDTQKSLLTLNLIHRGGFIMYGRNLNTTEARQEARKYYLDGCKVTEYPELKAVIGTYEENGKFFAMGFKGTQGKPDFHFSFDTSESRREDHISKWLESCRRSQEYKAEQKEKNKGVLTGAAACAAAIRQELKEKYPGVKFSVTSETFSMGNSVSVNWTDGPEYEEIETIVEGYQYGHFNGMEDIYEYKKDRNDSKPSAKYTHTNKHFSESGIQALKEKAEELGILYQCENNYGEFGPQLAERLIKEELQRRQEEEQEEEPTNVITMDFIRRRAV
jgi:hypothetical protein